MLHSLRADIAIIRDRDPAARGVLEILLCYPGLHALCLHRLSHRLWRAGLPLIPRLMSQLGRLITGVEIHPGARKLSRKIAGVTNAASVGNNFITQKPTPDRIIIANRSAHCSVNL